MTGRIEVKYSSAVKTLANPWSVSGSHALPRLNAAGRMSFTKRCSSLVFRVLSASSSIFWDKAFLVVKLRKPTQ